MSELIRRVREVMERRRERMAYQQAWRDMHQRLTREAEARRTADLPDQPQGGQHL